MLGTEECWMCFTYWICNCPWAMVKAYIVYMHIVVSNSKVMYTENYESFVLFAEKLSMDADFDYVAVGSHPTDVVVITIGHYADTFSFQHYYEILRKESSSSSGTHKQQQQQPAAKSLHNNMCVKE